MPRETVAVKEVDEEIIRLFELRADLGAQVGGIFASCVGSKRHSDRDTEHAQRRRAVTVYSYSLRSLSSYVPQVEDKYK